MGCGCNKGSVVETKYVWTSADGKQKVGNLNRIQATTRQNRKGGTVEQQ